MKRGGEGKMEDEGIRREEWDVGKGKGLSNEDRVKELRSRHDNRAS